MRVIVTLMIIGDHTMNKDTFEGEDVIMIRGGRPPDIRNDQERGYSRSGRPPDRGPPDDGGPPSDGGLPDDGGPPDDGGSSDDGRPPRNGRHLEMSWKMRTTRTTRSYWTSTSNYSKTTSSNFGHYGFRKYFWYSWPVNVAIS